MKSLVHSSQSSTADSEQNRLDPNKVAQSKRQWQLRKADYRRLAWKRRVAIARLWVRRCQLFFVARVQRIHNVIRRDSRTTSDKILVSVAFGLFTGCILLSIYLFCTRIMTTAGLLLGLVTVLGSLYAVFFVSDRSVASSIAAAEGDLANLRRYLAESRPALEQARAALADARQKVDALQREFRRLEKRAAQAPVQRSTPFDDFLRNAFNSLGYQAVVISRSGESRIHLVVEKAGVRTAIQLRPQEESIGKNAVQQAHSGMKAHACDRCAIITNGSFTPTAVEFARQVNCTLVDGPRIADLVAGKIEPFRAEHGP